MSESAKETIVIKGLDEHGLRISSKAFEEMVQEACVHADHLILETYGQHNVGGRIRKKDGRIIIQVKGPSGQRLGCMARPGSTIICEGQTSNDLGYLNIGADIIVKGDAGDGACNAMAQGRVMVGGSIGARGLTMTKWNPAFTRPELWVLGSVGDIFAEFNCGGIGVVCGIDPKTPDNVLGYRPCVGMVGGMIYYRGKTDGSFSKGDVKETVLDEEKWRWLLDRIPEFLSSIGRSELLDVLSVKSEWKALIPLTPQEKTLRGGSAISMAEFKAKIWDAAFKGDPLKDLAPGLDRTPVGLIVTGDLRRRRPYWANRESAAPCTFYCPTHIPTVDRLRLIREGRIDDSYRLTLRHTPFPASVCGAICPNLCMEQCSRQMVDGESIDIAMLGRAVIDTVLPDAPPSVGKKVAIIGGGPAGMSAAWQFAQAGIDAHIFEKESRLGGKMDQVIPWDRLPLAIWQHELARFMKMPNIHLHLGVSITKDRFIELLNEYEYVIVAAGAHEPRRIPFPGSERVITALDFLKSVKSGSPMHIGKRVVIIGAGNVGCDVACEAYRNGAVQVTLVDIQKPLAFGKEKDAAEALGAVFRWPVMTREVTEEGLVLADGEIIPADTVMISIGDVPALGFLPETIELFRGWIKTDETGRTSDPRIFAIGDVEKPGLITHALGAGKRTAEFIVAAITGKDWEPFKKKVIDRKCLTTAHYQPSGRSENQIDEAQRCLSCGSCRDCHLCETICPERAISRKDMEDGGYEYVSDDDKCIACGFCADTCPCGIWVMRAF